MKIKKICFVVDNFDSTTVNKNIGLLAQFFANRSILVDIVSNLNDNNKNLKIPYKNIKLIKLNTKKGWEPLDDLVFYNFIDKHLSEYDAVWCYRGRRYFSAIVKVAKKSKTAVVVKLDSDYGVSRIGKLILPIIKNTKKFPLSFLESISILRGFFSYDVSLINSNLIVYETPDVKKRLSTYFPREKLFFYPNSVRVENKPFVIKKNLIISVGRIVPEKSFESGIMAFSHLPEDLKKAWRYEIIGPYYDTGYIKKIEKLIIQLNLASCVKVISGLYGLSLEKKYNEAKILLMPYPKRPGKNGLEGQPNVIVEAMKYGVVPVATDVGSVSFLVKGSGVLLFANNPEFISKALKNLILNGKNLLEKTKIPKKRVENEFNLEKNAQRLLKRIEHIKALQF